MACDELNKRLEPARSEAGNKASWTDICQKASTLNINLTASHMLVFIITSLSFF